MVQQLDLDLDLDVDLDFDAHGLEQPVGESKSKSKSTSKSRLVKNVTDITRDSIIAKAGGFRDVATHAEDSLPLDANGRP